MSSIFVFKGSSVRPYIKSLEIFEIMNKSKFENVELNLQLGDILKMYCYLSNVTWELLFSAATRFQISRN